MAKGGGGEGKERRGDEDERFEKERVRGFLSFENRSSPFGPLLRLPQIKKSVVQLLVTVISSHLISTHLVFSFSR